ncbi:MAG: DUF5312 domain-containing protein [Treponema sp.]|nr:DUF5312 domain-containing protein [Treponema sp.]
MPDNDHFDRLVSGLSLQERLNLLEKLRSLSILSQAPLYVSEKISAAPLSIEEQYQRLPWYSRFWFFIQGFFRGRTPVRIFSMRQTELLGMEIEEQTAGLFNYRNGKLLPVFYILAEGLKSAARFFYSALDSGFNRDKKAYYAFLGSLEMPVVHSQLLTAVDPVLLAKKNPDASDSELRQMAFKSVDDALRGITEESRTAMYVNARSLFCLKELASFSFDKLLIAFTYDVSLNGYACPVNSIRDPLINLNNILFSMRQNPNMNLLGSLFIFLLQESPAESNFDLNREMKNLLSKAEESLTVIREFNRSVPLTKIIRCAGMNTPVLPREITGGEDWYLIYRNYWKNQADINVAEYITEKRRRNLMNSLKTFFNGAGLKSMENVVSDSNPDGFPIRKAFSLSFLITFYNVVFLADINRTLKSIFVNGEFSRYENRIEFDESYNGLARLDEMITKLDHKIAPYGEYGKSYGQAKQDYSSMAARRRKLQLIEDEAAEDAQNILTSVRSSVRSMISVLNGILGRDTKGQFLPLANLSILSDKGGEFINNINRIIQKLQKIIEILEDIDTLEI